MNKAEYVYELYKQAKTEQNKIEKTAKEEAKASDAIPLLLGMGAGGVVGHTTGKAISRLATNRPGFATPLAGTILGGLLGLDLMAKDRPKKEIR